MQFETKRRVLTVIMDGVGHRESQFGNAVALAHTPNLDFLRKNGLFTTLKAHGTYVGLPSDQDIGNSEVGHNALGAGRTFPQGASLINQAFSDQSIFRSNTWKEIVEPCTKQSTLHFLGLLSDGNVHSHIDHLLKMLDQAATEGVKSIRIHTLFDGRDVEEGSAETYVAILEKRLSQIRQSGCDAQIASGGGRMHLTMDRYNADWPMVKRGWDTHVLGKAKLFPSAAAALEEYRKDSKTSDQYFPAFCVEKNGEPNGLIESGDSVILFNFRGDRAIEICQAFESPEFIHFDREKALCINFAGMMQYDGDLNIPTKYLVSPPQFSDTLSELLARRGVKQFACSETQKFGHVTYFWNGNRSGYLDEKLECFVEIASDHCPFDQKPWMKAYEITEEAIEQMARQNFSFGRINLANGDMVGHTGNLAAAIVGVSTVDLMLGKLIDAARKTQTILVVTADHGNCDEMYIPNETSYPNWERLQPHQLSPTPKPKTSHTLAEVPFYVYDPTGANDEWTVACDNNVSLANVANTCLTLMGLDESSSYARSLIRRIRL